MLTSKQRAKLRSLASTMPSIFQIGKGAISDNLTEGLDSALTEVHLVQKDIPKFDKYNNAGVIENVETGWMETIFRKISMFLGYTFQTEAEFE